MVDQDSRYAHLDFDPLTVPISHAATIMLLSDRPDLHVLMLRRTNKVVFAPDNWVFPGGRVDPEDHLEDFNSVCVGLSDEDASAKLEIDHGGLAWWLACCRETLEEAGLLLVDDPGSVDVAKLRDGVRENEATFIDRLLDHDLKINAAAIEEVGRFVTPLGSPRRFDARFFVAEAPLGQEPLQDDGEIVEWEWIRPGDALERCAAGELRMMSPTIRMLKCLAMHQASKSVLDLAQRRLEAKLIRVADPSGESHLVLPGEEGYDSAAKEVEFGVIRIWESPTK